MAGSYVRVGLFIQQVKTSFLDAHLPYRLVIQVSWSPPVYIIYPPGLPTVHVSFGLFAKQTDYIPDAQKIAHLHCYLILCKTNSIYCNLLGT